MLENVGGEWVCGVNSWNCMDLDPSQVRGLAAIATTGGSEALVFFHNMQSF
jgi:hypothetical protein